MGASRECYRHGPIYPTTWYMSRAWLLAYDRRGDDGIIDGRACDIVVAAELTGSSV